MCSIFITRLWYSRYFFKDLLHYGATDTTPSLLDNYDKDVVVGFDTEFNIVRNLNNSSEYPHKVHLVQIAFQFKDNDDGYPIKKSIFQSIEDEIISIKHSSNSSTADPLNSCDHAKFAIVILQLNKIGHSSHTHIVSYPQQLLKFIKNTKFKKVGVNVKHDVNLVVNLNYNIITTRARSRAFNVKDVVYDLKEMGKKRLIATIENGLINTIRFSLSNLLETLNNKTLNKKQMTRLGLWDVEVLAQEQLKYAALDALAGLLVYNKLIERALVTSRLKLEIVDNKIENKNIANDELCLLSKTGNVPVAYAKYKAPYIKSNGKVSNKYIQVQLIDENVILNYKIKKKKK